MIEIAPEAALELLDACAFYDAQHSGLGTVFRVVWQQTVDAVEAAPLAFPVHPFVQVEGIRRALVLGPPRFPYALAYLIHPRGHVSVLATEHLRRVPGYWSPGHHEDE